LVVMTSWKLLPSRFMAEMTFLPSSLKNNIRFKGSTSNFSGCESGNTTHKFNLTQLNTSLLPRRELIQPLN
jgi:hypothetical protein